MYLQRNIRCLLFQIATLPFPLIWKPLNILSKVSIAETHHNSIAHPIPGFFTVIILLNVSFPSFLPFIYIYIKHSRRQVRGNFPTRELILRFRGIFYAADVDSARNAWKQTFICLRSSSVNGTLDLYFLSCYSMIFPLRIHNSIRRIPVEFMVKFAYWYRRHSLFAIFINLVVSLCCRYASSKILSYLWPDPL